jgi:adenylate kinase family enzyme
MIIGASGTGKSTLARKIGDRLDLPVVHLDRLFWNPGWKECPEPEFRARVASAAGAPAWVIDGNYSRTYDLRLPHAQALIWLDLARHVYFPRAIWRSILYLGRTRLDVGDNCPDRFDPSFIFDWVWNYPTRDRARTHAFVEGQRTEKQVIVLTTPAMVRKFVAGLPGSLCP